MGDDTGSAAASRRVALGSRARRSVVVATVLLGVLGAVALGAELPPGKRTAAELAGPVQSLMSLTGPFLGVLLVHDALRRGGGPALRVAFRAAVMFAIAVALFGVVLCSTVLAAVPSQAPGGRWQHAGAIAAGSVLVQVVAQLTGTGMGLLVRRPVVACLLTILPLGVWLLLGAVDALRPAQAWLTLLPSAERLLAGEMGLADWLPWAVALVLWVLGPHLVGLRATSRRAVTVAVDD